ncbi:MAG: peptidase M28, partial [bacterium]
PRVRTLEGMMLAWSPGTPKNGMQAGTIILPEVADSAAFQNWLPNVKGKFVLISMPQPTGRPDKDWEEFATKESFEKMKAERDTLRNQWQARIRKMKLDQRKLAKALEDAGAAAIIASNWSNGYSVNKIFGANTKKVPTFDLSLEDYGLVYRLTENGGNPILRLVAEAKSLGETPAYNTISEMRGGA